MDIETKIGLVKRPPTAEILIDEELRHLLETNEHPRHYIGFEISGLLHLGNLILSGFKINDLVGAGIRCQVYLADWHSFINNKFGGDCENRPWIRSIPQQRRILEENHQIRQRDDDHKSSKVHDHNGEKRE